MSEPPLDPELIALEQALSRLAPAGGLGRDALLFRAGQEAAHSAARPWTVAAALWTLAAVVFTLAAFLRPPPQGVTAERVVVVRLGPPPAEETAPATDAPSALARAEERPSLDPSYLRLRRQALEHGVDALPAPAGPFLASPPQMLDALGEPWMRHRLPPDPGDAL